MMTPERWLLCFEDNRLWLHERIGDEVRDRRVTREDLQRDYPRLAAELQRTINRDCPRILREPRR
jgi:hypothetical protein